MTTKNRRAVVGITDAMFASPLAEDLDIMRQDARDRPYWGYEPPRRLIYDCPHARVIMDSKGNTRVMCGWGEKLSPRALDGTVGMLAVLRGAAMPCCQDCGWYPQGERDKEGGE